MLLFFLILLLLVVIVIVIVIVVCSVIVSVIISVRDIAALMCANVVSASVRVLAIGNVIVLL